MTNLSGTPRWLYEVLYCGRGQAENLIEAHKLHLASDRTSCSKATAPPPRPHRRLLAAPHPRGPRIQDLVLVLCPVRHDPPRLLEIAARVTELVARIEVSLPSSYPYKQSLARFAGHAQALPP